MPPSLAKLETTIHKIVKCLLIFLLPAIGALVLQSGAKSSVGIWSASLSGQDAGSAVAQFVVLESKIESVQIRGRDPSPRIKLAPIVREILPPAPKMVPSFRQFKTTAYV